MKYPFLIYIALFFTSVAGQFPPTPQNVTTIKSKFDDGVTISYKEVRCDRLVLVFWPL
jgi:hypothetical protein